MGEISTFYAPGSGRSEPELGRIITINRGRDRGGFAWCASCEYAVAVEATGPEMRWQQPTALPSHTNPRTGEKCRSDPSRQVTPIDLAHVFETDVRAFLFSGTPRTVQGQQLLLSDALRRTLQEALRLGAAQLLETDARDLRALTQNLDGQLVVVIYDAVSGGAGYSARLSRDAGFAMRDLLLETHKVLNCRNPDCLRACARCLHEYSNQMIWHELDRHPALAWIEAILLDSGIAIPPKFVKQ